ncbi:MAG: J domain-containing protein [Planctomycetaceae bacterium]|jgi:hypothetical protein|nr:J domain-containing protein [Planctomycetaceae bacterium]
MYEAHYHTLGLTPGCSEEILRKRYLELVQQFPPELHPESFSKIHEAYEKLRDPLGAIPELLFSTRLDDSMEQIIEIFLTAIRNERLPTTTLLNMGE